MVEPAGRMPVDEGRRRLLGLAPALCATGLSAAGPAAEPQTTLAGHPVRIAFIDPLSGPAADIGRNSLRSWQFMASELVGTDNPSGVRCVVAGFDNKGSPRESLNAFKAAVDQGFRFIVQGNGSGVAATLSDAVTRHNLRRPDDPVVYINYAAMDPALTNELCSFWHFRVDADTSMKMAALTRFMAEQPALSRVFLLNQNYEHGQQFSRYFRQFMAHQRADLQIVGDELHAPFRGHNFSSHVRQMRDSGAQALVTGNWGADLRGLVQALQKERLQIPLYAYYPALSGVPELLARGDGRMPVYQVACNHSNHEGRIGQLASRFRQQTGEDLVVHSSFDGMVMLLQGIAQARSARAAEVAARMSGLRFQGFDGPVQLRADDHQLQKGVYISRWQKVDARHPRGAEGTGYTFVPIRHFESDQITGPVRCRMQRP